MANAHCSMSRIQLWIFPVLNVWVSPTGEVWQEKGLNSNQLLFIKRRKSSECKCKCKNIQKKFIDGLVCKAPYKVKKIGDYLDKDFLVRVSLSTVSLIRVSLGTVSLVSMSLGTISLIAVTLVKVSLVIVSLGTISFC